MGHIKFYLVLCPCTLQFIINESVGENCLAPEFLLNIVIEKKDKSCKTISYEGPVDGLKDLPNIVREAAE